MEWYNNMDFVNKDGKYNQTACAVYQLQAMVKRGFSVSNVYQCKDKIALYPSEVLAPAFWNTKDITVTNHTYAIHHYASTWWENMETFQAENYKNDVRELKKRIEK